MKKTNLFFTICLMVSTSIFTTKILAASFQSLEQSAARLGNTDAGTTTNTNCNISRCGTTIWTTIELPFYRLT